MVSDPRRIPLALRLAARLLPPDAREEVLGDLVEAWRERVRGQPRPARVVWLARQPLAAARARLPRRNRRAGRFRRSGPRRGTGFAFSWLDVKLAVRMLGQQPLLTVVAGLTLALGIPASLMPTHVLGFLEATLPVEDGHRVLGIRNWDLERNDPVWKSLHDFAAWREELRSFESIGAARSDARNVHAPDGRAAEVRGAEVTASIFAMLRVPPLMGRTLIEADEQEGAPDVVVVSEALWSSRFARDPDIVGRTIGIGRRPHTVVGVMPEGFLFPMLDHFWVPLRADPGDYAVGTGPDLMVFGRLAEGVSPEEAAAELQTIGARLAAEWPETHGALRPELAAVPLLQMGEPASGIATTWDAVLLQLICFSLLMVACGNVGVLVLARTATRTAEISVRTALGASRVRILSQLFVESLVLALGATLLGLVLAEWLAARFAGTFLDGLVPYWIDLTIGWRSTLFALGLAAVCAVVAGVLPALKATSPHVQENLKRNATGSTLRFGPFTTLLVVAEVALSVGFLCLGTSAMLSFMRDRSGAASIDVERYLVASLRTPWVDPTEEESEAYAEEFRARIAANHVTLRDRLVADGVVRHAAMGVHVAGMRLSDRWVVVGGEGDGGREMLTTFARVHVDYFRDLGIEILRGRGFTSADVEGGAGQPRPVVVNDQFVERVLGGGDAIGRRIRYASEDACVPAATPLPGEPSRCLDGDQVYEIVGVVETFGTNVFNPDRGDAIYHPVAASEIHPMRFVVEVAGDPVAFIPRLREIAAAVDPEAMIQEPMTLTEVVDGILLKNRLITLFVFVLSAMGMVLAATGLYALMSFTVSQRTREIGIRTALGAGARDVVAAIGRRATLQLLAGVALGSVFGTWTVGEVAGQSKLAVGSVGAVVAGVAVAVTIFGALACLAPTLRGLRIQPTEALREG